MGKKRRNVARDKLADSIIGRAILVSESVRKEFMDRLVDAISEINWHDEQAVIGVVRAYMATYNPLFAEHLSNAMILTWLGGYLEQVQHLPPLVKRWMRDHAYWAQLPPEVPGIFGTGAKSPRAVRFPRIEKAVETLFNRGLMTRPQYDKLSAAAKQATFTVAWIDDTKVIGKIRDALAEAIDEGPTLARFREKVVEKLETSPMSKAHSENVYRTGLMSAYRDGKESLAQHPIVQEVFRFRSFYATHDGRVRDDHLAFETLGIEGTNIYLSDDSVWDIATPPLGYQCRCITSLLRISDAARLGLEYAKEWLKTGVQPQPIPYCIDKVSWRPTPGFGTRHGPLLSVGTASSVRMSSQPIRMADANPWQPYKGPRGGTGWQRAGTDDVRYVKERPGAHETGGDKAAVAKPVAKPPQVAVPRESPLSPDEETRYSRGQCHALTAAVLSVIPSADPWGLFDTRYDDEIKHSVARLPNTETFIDATGAVQGKAGLESLKHNFLDAEHTEWRRLDEDKVRSMVTGNRGQTIRSAVPVAKKLIRYVESQPPPSAPPPASPAFQKADEDHYIEIVKRNHQMRLPRPGEDADTVRARSEWNERHDRQIRQDFRQSNVHLVDIPVSMLRIKMDRDVDDDRQARLEKIGGSDDPIMVSIDRDGSGGLMLNIDDGNNRAEWARKHGKKTIKAFTHEFDEGDTEALKRMLSRESEGAPPAVQHVTETPEFKQWFGKSKITGKDGKPLRVFHGTPTPDFAVFDKASRGKRTGSPDAFESFSFTDVAKDAADYARGTTSDATPAIMPVYLKMENPLHIDQAATPETIRKARSEGYDGLILTWNDGTHEFTVFEPQQIKSATGNQGTFSSDSPDIRMGDANPWQPYKGPRGGTGWQHSGTGDVRYVKDRPGAHETGGEEAKPPAKPRKAAKSVDESLAALRDFEEEFLPAAPPAGTPNRKAIWKEEHRTAQQRRFLPENVARLEALRADLQSARKAESARKAASTRAEDPHAKERQRIFRELRKLGFTRETTSGKSAYYRNGPLTVRVSDHDVPMTDEREWNLQHGGKSWANSRWSFVLGSDDSEGWLADIADELNKDQVSPDAPPAVQHVTETPTLTAQYDLRRQVAYKEVASLGKQSGNEHHLLLDRNGNELSRSEGDIHGTDLGNYTDLNRPGAGLHSIHNHPDSSPLSPWDLKGFAKYVGVDTITAVGQDGVAHHAKIVGNRDRLYDAIVDYIGKVRTTIVEEMNNSDDSSPEFRAKMRQKRDSLLGSAGKAMQGLGYIEVWDESPSAPPAVQHVTETPEFKQWFGKSKITGKDGKPLVIYTGQPPGLSEIPKTERSELPVGHAFFTTDKQVASQYAGTHESEVAGKSDFSGGRKGKVYPVYLSIQRPFDCAEFNEDEWAKHLLPDIDVDSDGYSNRDLADALKLDRLTEYDEARDRNVTIGYETPGGSYLPTDFSLDDAAAVLWKERSGQGDTLEHAIAKSPSAQLLAMFPEAGMRYIDAQGFDGIVFSDAEMGGTTIVPFSPSQIKMAAEP